MKSALVCLIVLLAGCSTPQPVLEQARNGAALTNALSQALTSYSERIAVLDAAREKLLSQRRARSLQFRFLDSNAAEVYKLAGRSELTAQYATLKASADTIAKARADAADDAAQYAKTLEQLMGPLPDINKNLAGVSKDFTALGTELNASEKLKLVSNAFKEIKGASSVASAPAPAASAASSPN
jgi:uncharacterized membrane protein YccC